MAEAKPAEPPVRRQTPVQGLLFSPLELQPPGEKIIPFRHYRSCPPIPGQGRTRKQRPPKRLAAAQQIFEFAVPAVAARTMESQAEAARGCDMPVAPVGLRIKAAMIDAGVAIAAAAAVTWTLTFGPLEDQTRTLTLACFGILALVVLVAYKLLWCLAGAESFGMYTQRLRLVDFDGRPVGRSQRLKRLLAAHLSAGVGIGLLWALLEEETLSWHDHISKTFITLDAPPAER
jgi:uncharacterized RDD family membrane protein YckC